MALFQRPLPLQIIIVKDKKENVEPLAILWAQVGRLGVSAASLWQQAIQIDAAPFRNRPLPDEHYAFLTKLETPPDTSSTPLFVKQMFTKYKHPSSHLSDLVLALAASSSMNLFWEVLKYCIRGSIDKQKFQPPPPTHIGKVMLQWILKPQAMAEICLKIGTQPQEDLWLKICAVFCVWPLAKNHHDESLTQLLFSGIPIDGSDLLLVNELMYHQIRVDMDGMETHFHLGLTHLNSFLESLKQGIHTVEWRESNPVNPPITYAEKVNLLTLQRHRDIVLLRIAEISKWKKRLASMIRLRDWQKRFARVMGQ